MPALRVHCHHTSGKRGATELSYSRRRTPRRPQLCRARVRKKPSSTFAKVAGSGVRSLCCPFHRFQIVARPFCFVEETDR